MESHNDYKNSESTRIQWIDALRALAIVIVVYSHCVSGWLPFFLLIGPIMMPLFFEISGYVYKIRDGRFLTLCVTIFYRIVVPWIMLVFLPVLLTFPIRSIDKTIKLCYNYISGQTLWFIPCYIFAMMLFFFVLKLADFIFGASKTERMTMLGTMIICIAFSAFGYILCELKILDFSMINRSMVVQFYFCLGYLFKKMTNEPFARNFHCGLTLLVLYILFVFYSYFIFPGEYIDVHLNHYFWLPYSVLLVLTGNLGLMVLAGTVKRYPYILLFIGKNSLVIYLFHSWSFVVYDKIIEYFDFHLDILWLTGLIRAIFAILLCCLLAVFFNRKLPFVVGLK